MKTLVLLLILVSSPFALAQKLNLDVGAYALKAKSDAAKVDMTRFGLYSLNATFGLLSDLDVGIGYSLFFANVVSGDMGYGPDISLIYYPFSSSLGIVAEDPHLKYREIEHFRPFVQGSFHQRQFQSAQSPYSGFGGAFGLETQWTEKTALRALVRYQGLSGPNKASLTQSEVLLGIQLQFK